ncbi:MAG TPA: acyl-CoA dehydrogenase family protein [Candidatus Limnocylindria bacterium]|nr:acyl-CoA dehydrogenase family protein [Candidatus Limnocylindria bacterium]
MAVAPGASWLVSPVGAYPQFTGADFTDTDLQLAQTAEDFVRGEVEPRLEEIEAKVGGLMPALLRRAGELGLLMVDIPERYGGLGLPKTTSLLVAERGALIGSYGISAGAHTGIGTLPIVYYGTEEQKQHYLPKLATGELLAAYALTEPSSGSDALAMQTRAMPAPGGGYRLTGTKQFITNAGFADLFTVFAKVNGEHVTAFLVERTTPGLGLGPEEHKLGLRGSSTRQVILEDALVPAERVLGQVGQGHRIAFNILNIGRFKLGAGSGGIAKECLRIALAYAAERKQFGQPIARFGMVQRKLADMATRIYVADSMSYRTAGLMDAASATVDPDGPDAQERLVNAAIAEYTIECSILKVFGTEACDFVADEALQILGGYGFTADYAIERHYRDNRVYRIFEGTNEINRLIIPATLLKRIGRGELSYEAFLQQVDREIADRAAWPPAVPGPLEREHRAAEVAKRVVAYVTRVLVEKDLASLKDKQQHLELLANMIIDAFAMDSVVNRTRLLLGHGSPDDDALRIAMTNVFVASANERVIDGACRLLVNEFEGEELAKHLRLEQIIPRLPVRTIAVKTRIAEALVARGLGPVFLR